MHATMSGGKWTGGGCSVTCVTCGVCYPALHRIRHSAADAAIPGYIVRAGDIITDHFRAIGPLCICVHMCLDNHFWTKWPLTDILGLMVHLDITPCFKNAHLFIFKLAQWNSTDFDNFWYVAFWGNLTWLIINFVHFTRKMYLPYLNKFAKVTVASVTCTDRIRSTLRRDHASKSPSKRLSQR